MHLYNVTLQQNTCVTIAIVGNFTGEPRQQQILLVKNSLLELLKVDATTGTLISIYQQQLFGIVRSCCAFKLTGSRKDFIVLGSDSGRIVILEYDVVKNVMNKLQQETFGKSGIRRWIPGQYLASDPQGRAVMIGAIERSKFVYILNRDLNSNLTISSPLEAHKQNTVCFGMVGLDVGFENPVYATLEVDFGDCDLGSTGKAAVQQVEKKLVLFELDLGLNHVVRKWSGVVDRSANHLISIPGGNDGPSGVLVCSENKISYYKEDQPPISIMIPERIDPLMLEERSVIIVSSVVHRLKQGFFILVQSELGDVFKLTLEYTTKIGGEVGNVINMKLRFFETLPVSSSLCLLKSGFLFVASEVGNHQLYQIENLGDDEVEQPEFESTDDDGMEIITQFTPRGLRNLGLVDEIDSVMPLLDMVVTDLLDQDSPQIYALCGKGARSSFRVLQHGLPVTEIAASELPGSPIAVWTLRGAADDEYDSYIVISFINATLVLSVGETVEEMTETGVLSNSPTICMGQLGEDALVQIYPGGIRHIRADKRVSEWKAPKGTTVRKGTCNYKQVCVALSNAQLVYFELDNYGNLNEFQDRKEMSFDVTSLALSPIPEGRQRAYFLVSEY